MPQDTQDRAVALATISPSIAALVVAGFLALVFTCSGAVSTAVFSAQSLEAGRTAARLAGPAIGFGFGALVGGGVNMLAFRDGTEPRATAIALPMIGSIIGAIGGLVLTGLAVSAFVPGP